jgi:hypothetical protein
LFVGISPFHTVHASFFLKSLGDGSFAFINVLLPWFLFDLFSLALLCAHYVFLQGIEATFIFYWLSSSLFSKVVSFLLVLPFEIQAW